MKYLENVLLLTIKHILSFHKVKNNKKIVASSCMKKMLIPHDIMSKY